MIENPLVPQAIRLEKLLQKLKVKHKQTVLMTQHGSFRADLYRTDLLLKTLTEDNFRDINALFQEHMGLEVKDPESMLLLLGRLAENGVLLRLERQPQVIREELRKWPDKMQLSRVT